MRKARMASRILRARVAWLVSRKFLATCWVMPEAPSGRLPGLARLATTARSTPMKSMPGWVKKRWSSAATKACEHALGHGGHRHEHALLVGIFGEQPAVGGVEPRDGGRLVVGELLVVGQAVAEMPEQAGHGAGADDQGGGGEGQQDFEQIEHGRSLQGFPPLFTPSQGTIMWHSSTAGSAPAPSLYNEEGKAKIPLRLS